MALRIHPIPDFVEQTLTLPVEDKKIIVYADAGDWPYPLVSHISVKKEIKNCVSAYLIFAKERDMSKESMSLSNEDNERTEFLEKYNDCFSESLPDRLPPERPEDHRIDLIPGSSPPNQPPYRMSLSQQEEIMKQVTELLEKGSTHMKWVMQNPRFLAFLQAPLPSQQVGSLDHVQKPIKTRAQVIHTTESMETPIHLTETMKSPRPVPNVQEQVAETPIVQAVPVQPATFQQPIAGSNGQGSHLQAMQQVFPPPSVHPGYFGGGSVFQSMAGHAPGNQFYTPGTVFGGAQTMMPNPIFKGQLPQGAGDSAGVTATYEKQLLDIKKVVQILEDNQFYVISKKSTFGVQEVSSLDFIIISDAIRLNLKKIATILLGNFLNSTVDSLFCGSLSGLWQAHEEFFKDSSTTYRFTQGMQDQAPESISREKVS
ncbi:hypothetical protein L7F22_001204 [Adiantum nelumboides]|nr:hypothetical protein [Adiantum nelumboides]